MALLPTAEESPLIPAWDDDETKACAGRALSIGRTWTLTLIRGGRFPVEVVKHGKRYHVRTADLRRYLGLDP